MVNHDVGSDFVYSVRNTVRNCVLTSAEICIICTSVIVLGISIHTYWFTRDGQWSDWDPWSECQRGLRTRSRYCNNPSPSIFRRYCEGPSEQYELCNFASYKDLSGSENLNSDISRQTADVASNLLSSLSRRTDLIEKSQERLDEFIKEDLGLHEVLTKQKKQLETEKENKIQQNLEFQNEIRIIKDAINTLKSEIDKSLAEHITAMLTDHAAFKEELVSTNKDITEIKNVTISEVKNIKDTFSAFEASQNKIVEKQNTTMKSIRDEFKQQVKIVLEKFDEQTVAIKETQQIKHAFDEFKEKTNEIVKKQETSLKTDYGQLKTTMEKQSTTVETVSDDFKTQIETVLEKVDEQTIAIKEAQQTKHAFVEFKEKTNEIVKEQETSLIKIYEQLKTTVEKQNTTIKTLRDEFKQQIKTVLEKVDEQTVAIKETQLIELAFDEFKEKTNEIVKEQETSLIKDYGQLKTTVEKQNTKMKSIHDDFKQQIQTVLEKVDEQTVTIKENVKGYEKLKNVPAVLNEVQAKAEQKSINIAALEREFDALRTNIAKSKRDLKVAFTAYGCCTSDEIIHTVIKFRETFYNGGGAYSTSTGRFTCKLPGIYHFAVTLRTKRRNIDYVSAFIRINNSNKLNLHSDPSDESFLLTAAGTFHLNKNDYVDIYGLPNIFFSGHMSYFTGFLVIPDA